MSSHNCIVTVKAVALSHIGCVRKNNEDNFFLDGNSMPEAEVNRGSFINTTITQDYHLFAVCDGMGGLNGGERASAIAIKALKPLFQRIPGGQVNDRLLEYAHAASEAVYADAKMQNVPKEGTTLALLMIQRGIGYIANIGDSRVYVMRMGRLIQVSRDHTTIFTQMLRGEITREQMRKHPEGNLINQYIGMKPDAITAEHIFSRAFSLCNGDRFLICSDGITDLLSHEAVESILANNASVEDAAVKLLQKALELGGKDNATCVIGDISSPDLSMVTPSDVDVLDIMSGSAFTQETTALP